MITEQQFLTKRITMLPRRGAEKEHTWMVIESDLPEAWLVGKPRAVVRTYSDLKTGYTWTFNVRWMKGRACPVLRVYR